MSEDREVEQLHDRQRSTVISSGIRSGFWGVMSAGLGVAAYFSFSNGLVPLALALGAGAALSAYKEYTTDVDQAVQFEDINAQRSAEYTAKALARELKNEGLVVTHAPGRSDGRSWEDFVADPQEHSQSRQH